MIQKSDVGIGISGKEGKHAALAADISIKQFSNLLRVLLWHGRLAYKGSSKMVQYIIYKGMLIAVIHATFICCYNISIPYFHSLLQVCYTSFYSFFPTIALALDEDITVSERLFSPT